MSDFGRDILTASHAIKNMCQLSAMLWLDGVASIRSSPRSAYRALRPGTIIVLGSTASFAGQIGPMLRSKVEIVVTSPSGLVRTITGPANKVGYFYQRAADFAVDEQGVWRARVKIWHDGQISAGFQGTPPFPTGDVLGSRDGEFLLLSGQL